MSGISLFAVNFIKVFNFIDPALMYVSVIYGVTKVYEIVTGCGSVWQAFWDPLADFIVDENSVWFILVPHMLLYTVYWTFGLTLVALEYFNKPKSFHLYKNQPDKSGLDDKKKLFSVRHVQV
jgi:hypothetical protein